MTRTGFYVSIKRGKEYRLLLGPYDTHADALANVQRGTELAYAYDNRTWFDDFGTCKVEQKRSLPEGIFGK